jgi:hypothetical protein
MTMMARKRSPIPRLADDYSREAAAKRIDFVGAATGARPAPIGNLATDEQLFRECLEPLGRNRPGLRGFNSEKEASWTG